MIRRLKPDVSCARRVATHSRRPGSTGPVVRTKLLESHTERTREKISTCRQPRVRRRRAFLCSRHTRTVVAQADRSATKRKSRSWGQHDRLRKVPVALGGRPRRVIVGVYERILRRRPPITCRSSAEKHSRSGLQHKVSGGKQGVSASRQPGRAVRTTGSFRCKICFTFAAPVVADADRLPALRARD